MGAQPAKPVVCSVLSFFLVPFIMLIAGDGFQDYFYYIRVDIGLLNNNALKCAYNIISINIFIYFLLWRSCSM